MKRRHNHNVACALMFLAAAGWIATPAALGLSYTWQAGAGGAWTVDGHWSAAGDPDDAGDTAELGDVAGGYTATLGTTRTIGGLVLSGSDPTLDLTGGSLVISGGSSTISGGLLTGSGTWQLQDGANVTWSSATAPGGNLVLRVPTGATSPMATLDNTGTWGLAAGQELRVEGNYTGTTAARVFTINNGFTSDGVIRIGTLPGPDSPTANATLSVPSGTLVNSGTGQVRFYPRGNNSAVQSGWSQRHLAAELDNQGQFTVYTPFLGGNTNPGSTLGRTGAAHLNSGTITLDDSLLGGLHTPSLTVQGSSFTNTGTLDINNGRLEIEADTFSYNSGSISSTGGTLALGRSLASTTVNWSGPDTTDALTYAVTQNADVTLNRASTWTLDTDQVLAFELLGGLGLTDLSVNQNLVNNGTIALGQAPPGDHYGQHRLSFSSGSLVNGPSGLIEMYPRSASNFTGGFGRTWSHREIEGALDNQGTFNVYSWDSYLGAAGADHTNSGTITFDSSITSGNGYYATLHVTGSSFLNESAGVIEGEGTLDMPAGVTLVNDGTLGGDLTVLGNVDSTDNSTLAPGSGDVGTLTVTGGALGLGQGFTYVWGADDVFGSSQVNVSGDITFSGGSATLDLRPQYDINPSDTFVLFTSTGGSILGTLPSWTFETGNANPGVRLDTGLAEVSVLGNQVIVTGINTKVLPEPGTGLMILLGGIIGAQFRRRFFRRLAA